MQHLHFATCELCSMCTLQHMYFAIHTLISTCALCNTCTLQEIHFATNALCNKCTLQHNHFATHPLCINIAKSLYSKDILVQLYHHALIYSFSANVCRNGIFYIILPGRRRGVLSSISSTSITSSTV